MPWKEPGKGDKDPWQSNSDRPPDLDDVFRSVGDRLRGIFGGGRSGGKSSGGGGGPSLWLLAGLALVLWTIYDSPHRLDESEQGVVLRFGEYVRTVGPGLRFTLPRPLERMEKVNISRVRQQTDAGLMLTGDENIVNIDFEVQYRISNAEMFVFNVRQPELTVLEAAESSIREIVGTSQMDYILEEGRGQVAQDSRELLQGILDRYEAGIAVTQFLLPAVKPPAQVQAAFDDVIKAREDAERFENEAQAYANAVVPEARGQAARVLQEAEGYRDSTIAIATGEASRFEQLLREYQLAPAVTRQRLYLQTLEGVLSRASKVMLDVSSGNNMLYLPLDQVSRSSGVRPPPPMISNGNNDSQGAASGRSGRDGRGGRQ